MRYFQIFIFIFSLFIWTGTYADSNTHRVQSAVDLGGIVKLDQVLEQARHQFPGRVLKVELEDEDDAPSGSIYEVKILKSDGSVVEVEYDAKTLKLLEVEGGDWKNLPIPSR